MLQKIIEILLVIGLSSIKFFTGAPLALFFGFSFLKTLITTILGGWLGVFVFSFFGAKIDAYFDKRTIIKHKKIFTLKNKTIIQVRQTIGIIGIVAITAPLITIPVGVLISARMFTDKKKLLRYHLIGVTIWGVLLTVFFKYLKGLFAG